MYRRFGGKREFKKYLYGRSDEGARLLFKFRSGKHGLNEELGRHSDRDGRVECMLCGAECESVVSAHAHFEIRPFLQYPLSAKGYIAS